MSGVFRAITIKIELEKYGNSDIIENDFDWRDMS